MVRRRDAWHAGMVGVSTRWADSGSRRWSRWRLDGINRCRRWADEGSHRPGEMAPPSWFLIGMGVAIAWYQVTGSVPQAWYWLARRTCLVLAGALYWVLTAVSYVFSCAPRTRLDGGRPS
jgi:hypothetical protein